MRRDEGEASYCEEYPDIIYESLSGLFNLRGFDKRNSPLFYSFALVSLNESHLFISNVSTLLTPEVQTHLNVAADGSCDDVTACVSVAEYDDAMNALMTFASDVSIGSVLIPSDSSFATLVAAGVSK